MSDHENETFESVDAGAFGALLLVFGCGGQSSASSSAPRSSARGSSGSSCIGDPTLTEVAPFAGRRCLADLPPAGRYHPQERLHRHQRQALQGSAALSVARSAPGVVRWCAVSLKMGWVEPQLVHGPAAQVVDVSTSKTGKHGHAKCHFVAVDIFTGKKYEDLTPSTHNCDVGIACGCMHGLSQSHSSGNCVLPSIYAADAATGASGGVHTLHPRSNACAQVPNIARNEYTLIDINDEGFVSGTATARQPHASPCTHACIRGKGRSRRG